MRISTGVAASPATTARGPLGGTDARNELRNAAAVAFKPQWLLLAAAVLLTLWFGLLDQRALWDPDEGRYAEIAREAAAADDWITPRLNDLAYIEKPPLQYWITATAFRILGAHNWTARLWSALAGLGCVFLTFYAARRLHSLRAGAYAGLALASSLLYFAGTHFNTLDAGVTLFLWTVMVSLAMALDDATAERARKNWIRCAWLAAGLAFMSKGLIGLVLPACALVVYAFVYRDHRVWRRAWSTSGAALMLAVTLPWIVAASRANPDFLQFFFIHEHFTRFATTEHHRQQPAWFFIPMLALGALPWTVPFLIGLVQHLRSGPNRFAPMRLLAVWCVVVFGFFSASGSKLALYILPVFPALAVLGGVYLCEARSAALRIQLSASALFAAVVVLIAAYVFARGTDSADMKVWAWAAAAAWAAGAAIAASALRRDGTTHAVVALATAAILAHQALFHVADLSGPHRSADELARAVQPYLDDKTRLYSVGLYLPSLSFYTGRTAVLVEFRDELEWGLTREPHKGVPTIEAFVQRWTQETDAVAIMRKTTYRELAAQDVPMQFITEDTRRVVVRRGP